MIIIFSKDRAFQLEACLRTLQAQCEDVGEIPIRILWTASNAIHRESYVILQDAHKGQGSLPIEFVEESDFRRDLILILAEADRRSWTARLIARLSSLGNVPGWRSFIPVLLRVLVRPGATLFVVDDTLFLRPFNYARCSRHLLASADRLAFSLRLGQDITRSYIGDCGQQVPPMTAVDENIFQFRWPEAEIDFEYPLEISSSLLHLRFIFTRLLRKNWSSPNTLEFTLAKMAGRYKKTHPLLLTFGRPRAVSAPLNIVQQDFTDNRHGHQERYHPDALCDLFLKGVRADLSRLDQVSPNSVHLEIDLLP